MAYVRFSEYEFVYLALLIAIGTGVTLRSVSKISHSIILSFVAVVLLLSSLGLGKYLYYRFDVIPGLQDYYQSLSLDDPEFVSRYKENRLMLEEVYGTGENIIPTPEQYRQYLIEDASYDYPY